MIERPLIFDIRTRPHQMQSLTGTKDLQMVNITLRVLTRPNIPHLEKIYTQLVRGCVYVCLYVCMRVCMVASTNTWRGVGNATHCAWPWRSRAY